MDIHSTGPARFTGERSRLVDIVLHNAVFELITLGFYRFWSKTRLRQYFWSNLLLAGEPLEYSGTAIELLKGFFIALLALIALGAVQAVVTFVLPESENALGIFYYAALLVLIQMALYRMWRYRLTRTRWRGVRFGLDGSTRAYVGRASAWWLTTIITAGLAYPWARIALLRYRIDHMRFGDRRFGFTGQGEDLFGRWLLFYLLLGAMAAVGYGSIPNLVDALSMDALSMDDRAALATVVIAALTTMFVPIAGFIVVAYGLFLWYRATELRYVLSNVEFGAARFTSSLRPPIVVRNTIYGALPPVLALAVLIGGLALSIESYMLWLALAFITWFFAGRFVSVVIVQFAILRHVAETLRLDSPEAFAEAAQGAGAMPGYGEGLADTLDVGAF